LVAETLADKGWDIGKDVYVAYSPERIDPGNEEYDHTEITKVIGGVTEACGDRAEAWYGEVFEDIVRVGSAREAEMTKLLENTFRSINIGMINEMAVIASELDIDIWEVIDAASTKPFGFMPFYPGPGLGGHCIPVDPQYLSWKANQHEIETRFIDLADRINRDMPEYIVNRVLRALNENEVPMPQADVLVLGVSYKPNVPDTRESPAYDIIKRIRDLDGAVSYHDPLVPEFTVEGNSYRSVPLEASLLQEVDCAIIVTDHSEMDIDLVVDNVPLVFDTRNATDREHAENVRRL
jgi:UDP-N-acetyl-D-glucosamine dehydrogenase